MGDLMGGILGSLACAPDADSLGSSIHLDTAYIFGKERQERRRESRVFIERTSLACA